MEKQKKINKIRKKIVESEMMCVGTWLSIGDIRYDAECKIDVDIFKYIRRKRGCKEQDATSDLYFEREKQSFDFVTEFLVFKAFQMIVFF